MTRLLSFGLIAGLFIGSIGMLAEEVAKAEAVDKAESARVQVAKLRGKLLYKRNQIRKLEKSACDANSELRQRMESIEKEKRTQYVVAEPKLEPLYAEQDALEGEILKLSGSKE